MPDLASFEIQRLNSNQLEYIPGAVQIPGYNPEDCNIGIVHIGIGAFHRAHQAFYTDQVLSLTKGNWRIKGVSLRSARVAAQLNPQEGLYTLVEQSSDGDFYRVIGAVEGVLVAPEDPEAVLTLLASESVKVVSLTITEKGYCHDPATGKLLLDHPDILHDLSHIEQPKTAVGFIAAALRLRMLNGVQPFTPLTCDNLPNNGELLRNMVVTFAERLDPDLAEFVRTQVSFPCTMIDRIVPSTTDDDRIRLFERCGYQDEAMVKAEPFSQWVIEDKFVNDRPAWEKAGVYLVQDVRQFEEMKLRLLNGSHSSIAYLGFLAGFEFVHQVMQESAFTDFVIGLMDEEITPSVDAPPGIDLSEYKRQLIARFSNPALHHSTYQIAMDGSQKLPQRLLNTLRFLLAKQLPYDRIAMVIAAWIRYVSGTAENKSRIIVQDPMVSMFSEIMLEYPDDLNRRTSAFFQLIAVFGSDLGKNTALVNRVTYWLEQLYIRGAYETVSQFPTLSRADS